MNRLYNILTHIAAFHLKIVGQFNDKLRLGIKGRAQTFNTLKSKINIGDQTIWFHCASLGEYEQGLPVFEQIKKKYTNHKIILSFFSPSGYEIRKNTPIADCVVYLPLDTKKNAKQFIDLAHPELVVFIKYEFWPNYLNELKKRSIKAILVSALFRKDQSFFKFYGKWMVNSLKAFNHIFVQNEASKKLLKSLSYKNVTVSGDTRFDRVSNQLKIDNQLEFIEVFKGDKLCVVAGSTWPEDDRLFVNYINSTSNNIKFIIAPHNIKSQQIQQLKETLNKKTTFFSENDTSNLKEAQVYILDTVGILSKIYSYADIAYVGGAMGSTGLHNTLEPAVFGIPIIIGKNHTKFPEAFDMISQGGIFSISTQEEFNSKLDGLVLNLNHRVDSGKSNANYILKNKGAVTKVLEYLNT